MWTLERLGQRVFELQRQAYRGTQTVTRPMGKRQAQDDPDKVASPNGPVFLSGSASTVSVWRHAFDVAARFFLGGIVACEHEDFALGAPVAARCRRQAHSFQRAL
jgi:hypothetical protein